MRVYLRKLLDGLKTLLDKIDFIYRYKTGKINRVDYVDINNYAEKVLTVKEKTDEVIEMPRIVDFIKKGDFVVEFPEINLWKFKDAMCFHRSDFIQVADDKIVWPKMANFNFSKNVIIDSFIYKYDFFGAYVKKPKFVHEVNVAYSLIGVHSEVWSHAVCDFIPKLFQIRELLKTITGEVTVLVPEYGKDHLRPLVYSELESLERINILVVKRGEAVHAKELFFMDGSARFTDHEMYVEIGDATQPKMVSDVWKGKIVSPWVEKYAEKKEPTLKLFLARRNGGYRMIMNNDEIEEYFKAKGYIFVEPHKLPLKDVVNLFHQAKYVVGPFSSAFTNLMFSQPGTKVLIMCNYTRTFETFLQPIQQHFGIDIHWKTGFDVDKSHPSHSSYYVSLEEVKKACETLGIE